MTWKDKLEIGLKDDAPFRRDNVPDFQKDADDPANEDEDAARSPEQPRAREDAEAAPPAAEGTEDHPAVQPSPEDQRGGDSNTARRRLVP